METGMKILKFSASNIKGIKVVEISPTGDVVTISGKNGAGKSTVLTAILNTLTKGKLPIRNGAKRAEVEINLGEYIVTRIITDKTDRLVVRNKEGAEYPTPKAFLSKFVGPLSIDPLAFVRLTDREQVDFLFGLIPGLEEELEKCDLNIHNFKLERTKINVETDRLKHEVNGLSPFIEELPENEVSVTELVKDMQNAQETNSKVEGFKTAIEAQKEQVSKDKSSLSTAGAELSEVESQLANIQKKIKTFQAIVIDGEQTVQSNEETFKQMKKVDVSEYQKRIETAEEMNKDVRHNKALKDSETKLEASKAKYQEQGKLLEQAQQDKSEVLASHKMPIDGLTVVDGEVTYKGVSVSQLSTAEKIRVGSSIAISQNPKAKIILADDVSLLDPENLEVLHSTCAGFQLWQVVNDTSGNKGFYIEEGELKPEEKKEEVPEKF